MVYCRPEYWPMLVTKWDLALVTHASVTSQLVYCKGLYMELPLRRTQKLWVAQNAVTHVVCWARPGFIVPFLYCKSCIGYQLFTRSNSKCFLFFNKVLYGVGPGCLKDLLLIKLSAWALRSSYGDLWIPPVKEVRLVWPGRGPSLCWPCGFRIPSPERPTAESLMSFLEAIKDRTLSGLLLVRALLWVVLWCF